MKILYFVRAFALNLYAEIHNAIVERINARREQTIRQYWQCGNIETGSVIPLGMLTEIQALEKVQYIKGDDDPIAFVDHERGFIAFGKEPKPASDDSAI